jgi:aminoglycoside phosphotransferase (APT) family kinase protein
VHDISRFQPDDPASIRAALERFLPGLSDISIVEGPDKFAGGLDTHVYGLTLGGTLPEGWPARVVLRVYPHADQDAKLEREFAVQKFTSERGFPAPKPLLAAKAGELWELPFMLMARAPGTQAMKAFPHPLRMRQMTRAMAALQARLHALPTDGCPLTYDRPLIDRMLEEPRDQLTKWPAETPTRGLRWLEENAGIVRDEQPVLLHNDYHPINIVAEGDELTALDWSDATIGDRHSDVARTLGVFRMAPGFVRGAAKLAPGAVWRYIISSYLRDYESHAPLDRRRIRYWEAVHAFREWVVVDTMNRQGEAAVGAREGLVEEMRGASARLQRYFEESADI